MQLAAQQIQPMRGAPAALPVGFIAVCATTFLASVAATIYFCHSMSGGMEMPGGWMMSMMWMRMPGQTWPASAVMFVLMWLAMMLAMMLPSAMPAFLKMPREFPAGKIAKLRTSREFMATGYFAVWTAIGLGIYIAGIAFAAAAMRWVWLSRAVPALSGVLLVIAGAFQFTRWKMSGLLRCRAPFYCGTGENKCSTGWGQGIRQGFACAICCSGQMLALLAIGAMNVSAMLIITLFISAEKLAPRPVLIARISGAAAVIGGGAYLLRALLSL